MTLDILSKTIFEADFNSLEGNSKEDLKAYNTVIGILFRIGELVKILLFTKFNPFYRIPDEITKSSDHLKNLVLKLI